MVCFCKWSQRWWAFTLSLDLTGGSKLFFLNFCSEVGTCEISSQTFLIWPRHPSQEWGNWRHSVRQPQRQAQGTSLRMGLCHGLVKLWAYTCAWPGECHWLGSAIQWELELSPAGALLWMARLRLRDLKLTGILALGRWQCRSSKRLAGRVKPWSTICVQAVSCKKMVNTLKVLMHLLQW